MLPAGSLEAELIGIINKPLLLHLVGVYIIYINDAGQTNIKFAIKSLTDNQNYKAINYEIMLSDFMTF